MCTACGKEVFVGPVPSTIFITENSRREILLVKRARSPKKGWWDVPGGFVELDENVEEALAREVKEETNASIKEVSYLGSYVGSYFFQEEYYPILSFAFTGKLASDDLKAGDDAAQIRFFSYGKIPFGKIAFIDVKQALKQYIEKKKHKNIS